MEAILGIAFLAAIINFLYKHSDFVQSTGGRSEKYRDAFQKNQRKRFLDYDKKTA